MLNGIKEIKLLNLKNEFSKKTNSHFENIEDYQYKGDFYFELYVKLTIIIQWITNALIILTSIWLIKKELIVIDVFITAFMYRINIFSFADSFTDLLNRIEEFNLVSNRIHEIMELYQPVDGEAQNEDNCQGKIEFIDVNFRYDKKEVLNNCCFKVEPQEFVVLTGKSGEGKTTILNLITKLYNIDSGKILIDDINIDQLSEQYIRKNISVISQNFYIFDMSIKENLLLAKPDATDEEIDDICKKVGIYDFIMSLPNKYETEVGEGGFSLSGGQRQRIAIARTLLKNSKIILCDEITSSLDKTLEKSIIELLEQLKEKHTIIVVTHKPDLIKKADKKYILENGTMYQEPQF